MHPNNQEPVRVRPKKPRGYEIASYILMANGAITLIGGLAAFLFVFLRQTSQHWLVPSFLVGQSVFGLIMSIVGISLYAYAQE